MFGARFVTPDMERGKELPQKQVVRQRGLWAVSGVRSELLLGDWECGGSFWSAALAVQEALKSGPGGLGGAKICTARSARG